MTHRKSYEKQTSPFAAAEVLHALLALGYEMRPAIPGQTIRPTEREAARRNPGVALTHGGKVYLDFKAASNPEGRAESLHVPTDHNLSHAQARNIQKLAKVNLMELLR
jgi:hypothetical protein